MTCFWGIGIGPGDSELLTLKAVRIIKSLQVLYVPKAHNDNFSFAEKIAAPYFSDNLIIKRRHFPMVNNFSDKQNSWNTIAAEIIDDVHLNQEVGFLTLGDPSVYSTYSYIANLLKKKITVKTVAGISSFSEIAAKLSMPLVLDKEFLEIIPGNADLIKLKQAVDFNDNLIIMKISTNFSEIYHLLQKRNLLAKTIIVENAAMQNQSIKSMAQYEPNAQLPYFSTAFIKKG